MAVQQEVITTEKPYRQLLWLILLLSAVVYVCHQVWQFSNAALPFHSVLVKGNLENTNVAQLQRIVDNTLTTGYLATDLDELKRKLEENPWVKNAVIERRWPDHIEIHLIEQVPYLRYGSTQLISTQGIVFKPATIAGFQDLALLEANGKYSETLFYSYREIEYVLIENNLLLKRFVVNQFNDWTLNIAGEITMHLGTEQQIEKFKRFIIVYTELDERFKSNLTGIDLRYDNGFVLGKQH
jgi:cell division protein FtsQ